MLSSLRQKLQQNLGVTITLLNLALVLVLILQYNPFGIFATGYAAASPLLDVEQSDVSSIEIRDPDFARGNSGTGTNVSTKVILQRQSELPRSQWQAQPDESKWFETIPAEYAWRLRLERGDVVAEYDADPERIAGLFESLRDVRRHHSVSRSPEKDRDLQMQTDASGQYDGLQLTFTLENGRSHTVYVGRSSLRGNQSYVRLDDESEIYLAETNLRSVTGPGEADYFRNRRLAPAGLTAAALTGISVEFSGANSAPVSLAKSAGSWRLQQPPLPGTLREEQIEQLAEELVNWKAVLFPEEEGSLQRDYETPPNFPFTLTLMYAQPGNLTDRSRVVYTVLGRKNLNNYLVRTADGVLCEVSSLFLEDLLNPREKLIESGGGVSPILQ